jgi:hypothetical protein
MSKIGSKLTSIGPKVGPQSSVKVSPSTESISKKMKADISKSSSKLATFHNKNKSSNENKDSSTLLVKSSKKVS